MKTSNIILVAFIGSISIYLLAAMTEVRLVAKQGRSFLEYDDHITDFQNIRYLKANNVQFNVSFSNESSLNLKIEKSMSVPKLDYHLEGDTLVIDNLERQEGVEWMLNLTFVSNEFRGIDCVSCHLILDGGSTDTLILNLKKSNFLKFSKVPSHFGMLKLKATDDSKTNLYFVGIEALDLYLDNSWTDIHAPVNLLTGSLAERSKLDIDEVLDFNIKKDASSMLNHRK
ncbi:MAG: hypothetical protein O2887_04105 [Bacteroidetes bacterium]|nr:hypothetical protein [Bacteroidota bacterium]MDA1119669.1 hypothetical protein [Bacteroidota bacterium]